MELKVEQRPLENVYSASLLLPSCFDVDAYLRLAYSRWNVPIQQYLFQLAFPALLPVLHLDPPPIPLPLPVPPPLPLLTLPSHRILLHNRLDHYLQIRFYLVPLNDYLINPRPGTLDPHLLMLDTALGLL